MKTVLICGDREWVASQENVAIIKRELQKLPPGSRIIHGCCRGADSTANFVALSMEETHNFQISGYPALWAAYGKGAGPVRNKQMLDENPDVVWAFHRNIENSKGTKNMVEQAHNKGTPVIIFKG